MLSEFVEPLKKYHSSGEINSKVDDPDAKMKQIAHEFSDGNIEYIDGISIEYDDWWCNVRKSNTEPVLRLVCEAVSEELMQEKRDHLLSIIRG
jgi:phosphomannomutase